MSQNYFTSHQIANFLDVPHQRVLRWIESGKLPARLQNGEYVVQKEDWRQAIKTHLFNKAWAAGKTHQRVLEILCTHPPGRILDVAAGPGAMSLALKNKGFDVYACDLVPEIFCVEDVPIQAVNLNAGLTGYLDEYFDYVVCLEVLEHVENHFLVLREIYRVLKPGGLAVLSTPNIAHIQSRLLFLIAGMFAGFKPGDFPLGHINPVYPPYLKFTLESIGFSCIQFEYNRGWIYTGFSRNTLLSDKGIEIPFRNNHWGQILIAVAHKE